MMPEPHLSPSQLEGFELRALVGEEKVRASKHLAGCADCRIALAELRSHDFALVAQVGLEVRDGFVRNPPLSRWQRIARFFGRG